MLEAWPGDVGVAGGTFDPPTFWFKLSGEVFKRSKAHFVGDIEAPRKMETWFNYEARGTESCHLDGSRNALIEPGADKGLKFMTDQFEPNEEDFSIIKSIAESDMDRPVLM